MRHLALILLVAVLAPGAVTAKTEEEAGDTVTIGVLAKRGPEAARELWQPTADYLDDRFPDRRVELEPLGFDALWEAVEKGEVDFVIANPYLYVEFEQRFGATRLLTVEHDWGKTRLARFGSVIFSRADSSLRELEELRGARVMAVDRNSLGGWLMARRLLEQHGIRPGDFEDLEWTGNHDAVVEGVLAGDAEAGVARSDTLERMSAEGDLELEQLHILRPPEYRPEPGFPHIHSTRLYPEWPLARLPGTDEALAREVTLSLLAMEPEGWTTWAGRAPSWTVPVDYQPVRELMQELELGPWKPAPLALRDLVKRHWEVVAALTALFLFVTLAAIYFRLLHRRLGQTHQALQHAHDTLELRVAERTRDLSEEVERHRETADQLRLSEEVIENLQEGLIITRPDGTIIRINHAFSEITGYGPEEAVGNNPSMLQSGQQSRSFYQSMWETIQAEGRWQGEVWNRRKDGTVYPEWLSISSIRDEAGAVRYYVGIFFDITDRKEAEERLRYLSYYDGLTGLANRELFHEHGNHALEVARRESEQVALMFMDLDRFKGINEGLGHAHGDALLREAARRMESELAPGDTLARLSGDEFAVLLEGVEDTDDVAAAASRLLRPLEQPFELGDQEIYATGSLGIAVFPYDGRDLTTLLRNAESAMYQAKNEGGNGFRFYAAEMNAMAAERIALEAELRRSVDRGEGFSLHYQPKVVAADGRIVGTEALLRWRGEDGRTVSPAQFVPVLEETGLIGVVGDQVLSEACRQTRTWREQGHPDLTVAVNLAAPQFRHLGIVQEIDYALQRSGLSPDGLELEITESMLMTDVHQVRQTLHALQELGVSVALDDFGTGYSSLAYLRDFPIDTLKIDRSFVQDLERGGGAVTRTILSLAENLGVRSVAEGVETEEQLDYLRRHGCDLIQGFLFARPADAEAIGELLRQPRLEPLSNGTHP
ncbi:EAL domain-containing protein [Thiohalospira sp.]|uniref:EAL domain-containing protein n=1 Tax=Thiohalospira sp. TaxID=3080549 RepID=UPI00397FEC07